MELNNWLYFREIQIDATNINMNLTDWLVAIKLDSDNFDFSKTQPSGADIRFTDSDGVTSLGYYIEDYDYINQEATICVKIPSIPANQTKSIYIWYGNPDAVSQSDQSIMNSGFQYNPDPFNDGSCLAFYPLDGDANDYSGNGYHGTWHGNEQYINGIFEQCAKFDGNSGIVIDFGFKLQCPFVYTGWFKPDKTGKTYQIVFGWDYGGYPGGTEFDYWLRSSNKGQTWYLNVGAHGSENSTSSIQVPDNTWVFFYAEFRSSGIRLILKDVNGNLLGDVSKSVNITQSMSTKVALGAWIWDVNTAGFGEYFSGCIDHTRIFNRLLTDDEIFLLSQQLPYSIGNEIFHGSKLSGVVCDKYGIPIVDKPVKIFIFDKDSGKLYRTTTSDKGKWEADHLPVAENSKVLVVYTLEGNYRGDNDLVGGEFSITQPL